MLLCNGNETELLEQHYHELYVSQVINLDVKAKALRDINFSEENVHLQFQAPTSPLAWRLSKSRAQAGPK